MMNEKSYKCIAWATPSVHVERTVYGRTEGYAFVKSVLPLSKRIRIVANDGTIVYEWEIGQARPSRSELFYRATKEKW